MAKNSETIQWLVSVPASDANFRSHLEDATIRDCEEALKHVGLTKTAIAAIKGRLAKLQKEPAAKTPAPSGARTLTLEALEVLPPVKRVGKGKPATLDVLETQIRDLLQSDFAKEQAWRNEAIYDRVALGLCLLKGRDLHLQKAGRPKNSGNVSAISGKPTKADEKAELGFTSWVEEKFPTFHIRSARNYMNAARNCGLTSDHTLEDVEALKTAQALHDKSAKELYRIEAPVAPEKPGDVPPVNLVADVQRDLFSYLDQALSLREEMDEADYESTWQRIQATLERLTGCRWKMTDEQIDDGAQHGDMDLSPERMTLGRKSKRGGKR